LVRFITKEKLNELYDELENLGVDILYISDSEAHREVNLKYLTGHPEDASLFIDVNNRQTILVPWDYQLAQKYAEVNEIIDIANYNGGVIPATFETLKKLVSTKPKIGVLKDIPYLNVKMVLNQVPDTEIIFKPRDLDSLLDKLRSTKSSQEISLIKKSFKISNQIVNEIEQKIVSRSDIETEVDLAIFVESQMRKLGAFGIGFETLVANSSRSWQIHTYPRADPGSVLYQYGLGLIDFGVDAAGLTSDVTVPFVFGNPNAKMKKIIETVKKAHDESISALDEVNYLHEVAEVATGIIEEAGYTMPHSLGHGIGLTIHDSPFLRNKPTHETLLKHWVETPFEEGMIVTIEPGIYEQDVGGFRLENDVIITQSGPEVMTNSRPIFIDL
jgi:Xaa-Pro dipeptidase